MALNLEQTRELWQLREARTIHLATERLSVYAKESWKILEPDKPLLWGWHHDAICEYLTACKKRQIKRLIINMPPRQMKSILVSVNFPTWVWTEEPEERFLSTSYSQGLSTKHSVDRRTIIESPWYQNAWGKNFELSTDQNVKTEFMNTKRGHMIATSMTGTATGKGGDFVLVDDPHDTTSAASETQRETDIINFDQKFTSRLDDKKEGVIIIVMQRLNTKDLTGHLLAKGGYEHLCLPGIAEKKTIVVFPISKKEKVREVGEVLHPEREGMPELDQQKRDMGSQAFAGQVQQNPTDSEGGMIKRKWCAQFYRELPGGLNYIQSWDMSFKDSKGSDKVAGHVWAARGAEYYLVDRVNDRMDFVASCAALKTLSAKHKRALTKLVEDKANGPAIIAHLKKIVPGLVPVEPQGSKVARLSAVAPLFEAGNVWLPDPSIAPWVHDFIEELVAFPNGANDDDVDACSQALIRLKKGAGSILERMTKL